MTTLTVTQLNRQVRWWLEQDIGAVSVVGELSNWSKPASGHYYFTLKDQTAQIKCAYFRNYHKPTAHQFNDGQQVIVQGKLSLYEARGEYQLLVQTLTPYGFGELYKQFELLKNKLEQQGLFAQSRKKAIPRFPQAIGVITSSSGAALHDILTTLERRYPLAPVYVYACEVQGKTAAFQLTNSLKQAERDNHCEVIILARGGGSIEDLWSFNNEQLALAISRSHIPVVTGVGHETDFTIADFVADFRAATPTAAAEAVTPNQYELLKNIHNLSERLIITINRIVEFNQLRLTQRLMKVASPQQVVYRYQQQLTTAKQQLHFRLMQRCQSYRHRLQVAATMLHAHDPRNRWQQTQASLQQITQRLKLAVFAQLKRNQQRLQEKLATLQAVSPLATLERGYAIASYQGNILFASDAVPDGAAISVKLARGELTCEVLHSEQ